MSTLDDQPGFPGSPPVREPGSPGRHRSEAWGGTTINDQPGGSRYLCAGATLEGRPCAARPHGESAYCYWHDPATGGQKPPPRGGWGDPLLQHLGPLRTLEELHALLQEVAVCLATREQVEPRRVTALLAVTAQILKVLELARCRSASLRQADRPEPRTVRYVREVQPGGAAEAAQDPDDLLRQIRTSLDEIRAAGLPSGLGDVS